MSEKRKEVKMSKSVLVNVSANDLWQIIGPGFAEAGRCGAQQWIIRLVTEKESLKGLVAIQDPVT